jgi:type IV secretory pathway VirB9-like protein
MIYNIKNYIILIALVFLPLQGYSAIKKDKFSNQEIKKTDIIATEKKQNISANSKISRGEYVLNKIKYNPLEKTDLILRQGVATTIVLPEWESIETFVVGDPRSISTQKLKDGRRLIIQPKRKNVETNLSIFGKNTNYHFLIRAYKKSKNLKTNLVIYIEAEKPKHPTSEVKFNRGSTMISKGLEKIIKGKTINSRWSAKGSETLKPTSVFDDGKWVYLYFGNDFKGKKAAVPYEVNDGLNTQVNFRRKAKANLIIIESLNQDGYTLKNGDEYVCIKPKYKIIK